MTSIETPVIHVYISATPEDVVFEPLFPSERNAEIEATQNRLTKIEKYCVWRLLSYGLWDSFGLNINKIDPSKNENGRWTSSVCDFSISHSGGAVAVAISSSAVGIDIEEVKSTRSKRFAERTLADIELCEYQGLQEEDREKYLISKWTEKEALFKSRNGGIFIPPKTARDDSDFVKTETICISGKEYVYSVASQENGIIKMQILDYKQAPIY